jgi:predicted ribosome quality control (RQC) complex YloA/Tae2 family protein
MYPYNNNQMKIVKKFIQSLNKNVEYKIGENAEDNFNIIDHSHGDDIWFHVQGASSTHVVASIYGMNLDKKHYRQIVTQGAVLCKQNSKYYAMSNLAIIYTTINNIEKSTPVGTVIPTSPKVKII